MRRCRHCSSPRIEGQDRTIVWLSLVLILALAGLAVSAAMAAQPGLVASASAAGIGLATQTARSFLAGTPRARRSVAHCRQQFGSDESTDD